jgi:hypothetical protein
MSCSPFDLRDYFLKELPLPQALQMEDHVRGCPACAEELDRLRLTEAALMSLREEEVPRRIAFVSDPVLEPAGWKRVWAAFWSSTPRLAFASVAMLSAALVVFSLTRPGPVATPAAPEQITASAPAGEVQKQIQAAVNQAVRDLEARQAQKVETLVAGFLEREQDSRQRLTLAANELEYRERENRGLKMIASGYRRSPGEGGAQ